MEESFGGLVSKEILKGVSVYFNPGSMIGIMGPTGSGKTTLLDVLTGRTTAGTIKVELWCCECFLRGFYGAQSSSRSQCRNLLSSV